MAYVIHQFSGDLYINNQLNWVPHAHIHSHLEIVYITKGSTQVCLENKVYQVNEGELFFIFPNQIHRFLQDAPVEGYIIVFSPDFFKELKRMFQTKIPTNSLLHKEELSADIICDIEKMYQTWWDETTFSRITSAGCLLKILGELLDKFTFINNPGDHDAIKRILYYCMEHYLQPITLEQLSKELYLSEYYISRIFHERMNTSYIDFINTLRVEHACNLLGKNTSITDVAYESGFSSVRTFNRAFQKHMNMTPREYLKSKK